MRCHYDVLEVAQGADDAAVRSAYRRCALQWHPGLRPGLCPSAASGDVGGADRPAPRRQKPAPAGGS